MDMRADIIEAFESTVGAVDIIAAVYNHPTNGIPPKGKAFCEIEIDVEGPNTRVNGGRPNNGLFNCPIRVKVTLIANIPKDMDGKEFQRNVVRPVQNAIEASPVIRAIDDEFFLEGANFTLFHDNTTEGGAAEMVWLLNYQHVQNAS